jgi:hypothetical protein
VRTWQFIAVATALYFGSAAPAAADELPLVPIPADAAAVVETIAAEVAPDVAPLVAEVTTPQTEAAAVPSNEPAPTAVAQPERLQESQYHEPESQYQSPATADLEPVAPVSGAPDAAAAEENGEATAAAPADPAATPTAATVDDSAVSGSGAPDTWIWNWTWNCDPQTAPPAELPADANAPNWVWNWAWNCDAEPNAGGDSSQYQSGASQYQPENTNVSIRIGSPGDNGPVTQTIAAASAAVATSVSSVAQTVVSSALGDAGIATPAPNAPPSAVIPVVSLPVIGGPIFPPLELPLVPLPPISLPALPPLEISLPPVVGVPAAAAIVEAVQEALDAAGVQVAATASGGSAAPPRPRTANARVPQHVALAGAGASWSAPVVRSAPTPVQPHGARSSTGSPTSPGFPPRPRLPRPNAPAIGGAQLSSSANGVLGAFAALLAAYFLLPYLAARPVRASRDRRRLRPRASRFDPPG